MPAHSWSPGNRISECREGSDISAIFVIDHFVNQAEKMLSKGLFSPCVGFAFLLGLLVPSHGEDFKLVPIASYANRPDVIAKEGNRISAIFAEHKIRWVGAGSKGFTLSVPASQAGEAMHLLAQAIKDESLRITLAIMNADGTRFVTVTPDEVFSWRER
jgi:hypothetical protein